VTSGDEIFVTGMLRSGTTLLEKLLARQERISMLSQPFPLLYIEAKRSFLNERGYDDRYPLGHLFRETRYTRAELADYVSRWHPSRETLGALFAQMETYSGQLTRFGQEQLAPALDAAAEACGLAEVVSTLLHRLAMRPEARWFGAKEVTCEELVPILLDHGFRCAIILRDPRDVITSLNHGSGRAMTGDVRPTLFNVRAWRKSVAIARECEASPRFHSLRYEDLCSDSEAAMRALGTKLGIEAEVPRLSWSGNSSHTIHDGISTSSIGMHRALHADR